MIIKALSQLLPNRLQRLATRNFDRCKTRCSRCTIYCTIQMRQNGRISVGKKTVLLRYFERLPRWKMIARQAVRVLCDFARTRKAPNECCTSIFMSYDDSSCRTSPLYHPKTVGRPVLPLCNVGRFFIPKINSRIPELSSQMSGLSMRPTPRATGGAVCRTTGRSLVRSVVILVQRVARSRDIWRDKTHMSCDLVASSFNCCSHCTTLAPGNMTKIARLGLTTVVSWCSGRSPLLRFYILLATQRQHFYNRMAKIFSKKYFIARVRRQLWKGLYIHDWLS